MDLMVDLNQNRQNTPLHLNPGEVKAIYLHINQDAAAGHNALTIRGFPPETAVVNVWVTENKADEAANQGDHSHIGAIKYYTRSVQYDGETQECRVLFDLDCAKGERWPTGAMVMLGA